METKRQRLLKIGGQLKQERQSFEGHWREIGEHLCPRRMRFTDTDRNRGDKRNQKIINGTPSLAWRTLRAGLHAGISSPARPWRRLTTPDPDLAEFGAVKDWLYLVNKRMITIDLRSNLHKALSTLYGDEGAFGTGAMGVFDDEHDLMRCYTFPVGSYWLACDQRGVVDTFMREFQLTVRQLVMMFGDPDAGPGTRWQHFSAAVKNHWDNGEYETPINVTSFIYPNEEYHPERLHAKYKKFSSCYFEMGSTSASGTSAQNSDTDDVFLRESGFDYFPILAPRWDLAGEDTYGTSCPGMEALGDMKELQSLEKKKSKGLQKQIDPPLTGPVALRNQKTSLLAGDITYVDTRDGMQGLRPIHETNLALNDITLDIKEKEQRISRVFYEDLFLMLAQSDRRQITAREVDERHEEKLLALGPVLEGQNDEVFDPLTDIEFDKMKKAGLIPKPPAEIAGMDLRVEYVSIMAQAQKLVGVAGMERFMGFTGNLAAVHPPVLDKINFDQSIDDYAEMMGVSSKALNTEDEVTQIRDARAKAQQQQAQMAASSQVAQTAQVLSQTDTSRESALTKVLGG